MPDSVTVWESHTGTVTIPAPVTMEIVDNITTRNINIINITAANVEVLVPHDRATVLNKLQQLGYRQIQSAVPGERAQADWAGWRFWVLEK